jgi:phosphatidylglycerophosphatase A
VDRKYNLFYKIKSEINILTKHFLSKKNILNNQKLNSPAVFISTWFGVGLVNPMSGTWGTLAGLPFAFLIMLYGNAYYLLIFIFVFYVLGFYSIKKYCKTTKISDHSEIVIDEVVGVWIALLLSETNYYKWIVVFLIFRILDITKPWPASHFDKKTVNSHSIMLDDVVAGIYTLIIVELIWLWVY